MVGDGVFQCEDLMEWGQWFDSNDRAIARDHRSGVRISTVFLAMDHILTFEDPSAKPILWETMIFGGPLDGSQWRYDSLEQAKKGHRDAVRLVELTSHWWGRWWHCHIEPFYVNHIQPYVEMI